MNQSTLARTRPRQQKPVLASPLHPQRPSPAARRASILALAIALCAFGSQPQPPLAGRPANFTGWIGSFTMRAHANPTSLRVGEALHFTLEIQGRGRVGQPPKLTIDDRMTQRFDVTPTTKTIDETGDGQTTASYQFRLAPRSTEVERIPPVQWAYFDDNLNRYQTRWTSSIPISVTPPSFATAEAAPETSQSSNNSRYWMMVVAGGLGLLIFLYAMQRVRWLDPQPIDRTWPDRPAVQTPDNQTESRKPFVVPAGPVAPDAIPKIGRDFRAAVAKMCVLPHNSATTHEILEAAAIRFDQPAFQQLEQLLTTIDRITYRGLASTDKPDELVAAIANWARNNNI